MGMFVSGRVAITATGVIDEKDITADMDVVFIRPKMDYGTRQRVLGSAAKLIQGKAGNRKQRRAAAAAKKRSDANDVQFDIGAYQIALLAHNILAWQGPAFAGHACVAASIETLNPDEPLVQRVLQEISDRNTDPNAASADDEGDDEMGDDPNVLTLTATTA